MAASITEPENLDKDHARAIASLAEKLHLPLSEVRQTYLEEFDRLKSRARIAGFVEVLAVSNARSVLRSGKKLRSRT
jgi:hypothetical protein